MFAQLARKLREAARVLVLILHARRTRRVGGRKLRHTLLSEGGDGLRGLALKLFSLAGLGAVAAAGDDDRMRAIAIVHAEMQRGEATHGEPDHMRLLDLER